MSRNKIVNKHILLIDDDRMLMEPLVWRLQQEGFAVQSTNDNDNALRLIRDKKYDIIIQDIMRPPGKCLEDYDTGHGRLSGIVFYEKFIRNIRPTTPVIFLTACGTLELFRNIGSFDNCCYIQKPALPSQIVTAIGVRLHHNEEPLYKYDDKNIDSSFIIRVDFLTINQELLAYLSKYPKKIYSMTPRKFEELVAQIFSDLGYEIILTPETHDGGFDIRAVKKDSVGDLLYLVECKKYAPENLVGVGHIRSLYGIKCDKAASAGILVTSSFFTESAKAFQHAHPYELGLKDFENLKDWLKKYK